MQRQPTVLCLASYYKGASFLTAAKALGARVLLLTREKNAAEPWPRESIDEVFLMPDLRRRPDILYAVSYLTRANAVDAIVPLDDYDVETAAALREHLRLPGLGETGARYFRDKLAMRTQASAAGIPVPPFTPVFSYDRLRDYMAVSYTHLDVYKRQGRALCGWWAVGDQEPIASQPECHQREGRGSRCGPPAGRHGRRDRARPGRAAGVLGRTVTGRRRSDSSHRARPRG